VGRNSASIRAIRDIRTHSDRIYHSRNTAADFFAALLAARIVDGLLWGRHWWWGPWGGWVGLWCGGFVDIYYESIDVIDVDISVIDAEIVVEDYLLDAGLNDAELYAIDDELGCGDFDLSDSERDASLFSKGKQVIETSEPLAGDVLKLKAFLLKILRESQL